MTVEIDPQRRIEAVREAVERVRVALTTAGLRFEVRGAFALAMVGPQEPAPTWALDIELVDEAADSAREHAIAAATAAWTLNHAIAVHRPGEYQAPCRSFAARFPAPERPVVVEPEEPDAPEEAPVLLPVQGDWSRKLRGRADRILEIAALAAATGLRPSAETIRAMIREGGHVLTLDREVWLRHFDALLCAPFASVGLALLQDVRVLPMLLPEVSAMVDFHRSCPVHHKDIWDHTLQVVDKCPPLPTVRWSALMHDVGKVWTRTISGRGKVHFFRHEELGAILMEGVAARFLMPDQRRDAVCYVIANHARANVYSTEWTDAAVRRLMRDMGDHLDDVLAFSRSDFTTKRAWRIREVRELGEELIRRMAEIREADARVPPLPKGFGNLVMERTGRPGGRWLGDIQRRLEAEVEAGTLAAGLDAESYFSWVEAHAADLLQA